MENVERGLNSLISEYLTSRGYLQTVASFKAETGDKSRAQQNPPLKCIHPEFLEAFDGGEGRAFFELWNEHVPSFVRSSNSTSHHLECNISAYFAVYPIRTGIGNKEQAMSEFRSYLDSRGSVMSQNKELAAYFALPYIPDPSTNPSFQNLFTKSWNEELRAHLVQFLEKVVSRPPSCPILVSMYLNSQKQSGAVLQEKIGEVQAAYHTLCSIAMELVGALESSVAGEQIAPEFISGICSRLFENRVQPSSVANVERPSTNTLRASIISLRQSVEVPATRPLPPLDFSKIKATLQSGSSADQTALLQALRWRLTRSLPGPERDAVLASYISNDILGCHDTQSATLTLMQSPDPPIREQLARLLNTFSSLAEGRSYLAEALPITKALLDVLYGEGKRDTPTRRNALGAIQKLSLRRSISCLMIKHSIVKWIVENSLGTTKTLSDYTLRYSLALLMNISLRAIGRSSCAALGTALLKALGSMLGHKEEEVSEYVNGTLYSLFTSPQLQQQARQMGMGDLLEEALQQSSPQQKTQLQYVLHQLHEVIGQEVQDMDEDQKDDEDDEVDPDMIEGDEGEVVMPDSTLRGETLLAKAYSDRPQTKSLPSREHSGQAVSLPTISSSADKGRSSTKEKLSASVKEAREKPDSTGHKSDPAMQQSVSSTQGSGSDIDARQKVTSSHSVEPSKQRSAEEPITFKNAGKQQLVSVLEENEQPPYLPAADDAIPGPSFRPVTPQSFKTHPRHNSADIKSSFARDNPHPTRKIVSASPY